MRDPQDGTQCLIHALCTAVTLTNATFCVPLDFCKKPQLCPCIYISRFLDVFAKLRKATVSFIVSVRASVCMEQLGSHRTDFHEI
jgi:hypothetical protein